MAIKYYRPQYINFYWTNLVLVRMSATASLTYYGHAAFASETFFEPTVEARFASWANFNAPSQVILAQIVTVNENASAPSAQTALLDITGTLNLAELTSLEAVARARLAEYALLNVTTTRRAAQLASYVATILVRLAQKSSLNATATSRMAAKVSVEARATAIMSHTVSLVAPTQPTIYAINSYLNISDPTRLAHTSTPSITLEERTASVATPWTALDLDTVALWYMDAKVSNQIIDSANGFNLPAAGGTAISAAGRPGPNGTTNCLLTSSSNFSLSAAATTLVKSTLQNTFTFEFWIKPVSASVVWPAIFAIGQAYPYWWLEFYVDVNLGYKMSLNYRSYTGVAMTVGSADFSYNNWHCVQYRQLNATSTTITQNIWVDNVNIYTGTNNKPDWTTYPNPTFKIGGDPAVINNCMNGYYQTWRISNTWRSDAELDAFYHNT
jgi:hypothetical protein